MIQATGIGNSTVEQELDRLQQIKISANPIGIEEFESRIAKAAQLMNSLGIDAIYLHAGTNLYYFTGMKWGQSERMVGCILTADGLLHFIAPRFEEGTINEFMLIKGKIHCWEEHESPYKLFFSILKEEGISNARIAIDEQTPFFVTNGLDLVNHNSMQFIDAKPITAGCRMSKSRHELDIMQTAMDITLEVQKSAASILRPGIKSEEVVSFIHQAHKACGISSGSYFCIVLFGVDSSFPHGVKKPKALDDGEIVLIDTGCQLHGYISDITRSYVYGTPTSEHRTIWSIEKETQQAAFEAAILGNPCSDIDDATRKSLVKNGLGPNYTLPGTPHRTGHGIGLDIHEWPYIVKGNPTTLEAGMTFSNEPMICVPQKFGIRLEDQIYMDENGANWFTQPSSSIENPLNYLK